MTNQPHVDRVVTPSTEMVQLNYQEQNLQQNLTSEVCMSLYEEINSFEIPSAINNQAGDSNIEQHTTGTSTLSIYDQIAEIGIDQSLSVVSEESSSTYDQIPEYHELYPQVTDIRLHLQLEFYTGMSRLNS